MAGRLNAKTAVITGSSRGIGKGIAQVFAAGGARVLIVGRDPRAGNAIVEEIRRAGGEADFCRADVSRWSDAEALTQKAVDRFGRLDILVSNAGIFPSTRIEVMTEADWDHVQGVNLKGTFFAVKASFIRMKAQHSGRIVLTSSITGPVTGFPGWAAPSELHDAVKWFIKVKPTLIRPTINVIMSSVYRSVYMLCRDPRPFIKFEMSCPCVVAIF